MPNSFAVHTDLSILLWKLEEKVCLGSHFTSTEYAERQFIMWGICYEGIQLHLNCESCAIL